MRSMRDSTWSRIGMRPMFYLLWPSGRAGHYQPRTKGDRDVVAAAAAELADAHQHYSGLADD